MISEGRSGGRLRQALLLVGVLAAAAVLATLFAAWQLPQEAPLARMYRTEADLTVLVKALETYRAAQGTYPPAGAEGLRTATDFLSRKGHYLPGGPPTDGWDRPYHYAPARQYADSTSGALRDHSGYFAPDTFQVYSSGADGDAGVDQASRRADNIVSWDKTKSWRETYHRLNVAYMKERIK